MKPFCNYARLVRRVLLGGIGILLLSGGGGKAYGNNIPVPNGKVRIAVETKTFTQAEAAAAVAQGYVDLWVYYCFNQAFVDAGYITVNGGQITNFRIITADNTHSLKMIYEDGSDDTRAKTNYASAVASFAAPNAAHACPGRGPYYQEDASVGKSQPIYNQICPTWAYGSSSSRSSTVQSYEIPYVLEQIEAEGQTWYALRMYQYRFNYEKPQSFYVTFYTGPAADGNTSNGASTFLIQNGSNMLVWDRFGGGNRTDWAYTDRNNPGAQPSEYADGYYGFIRGGVVVESSLSGSLALTAACPGEAISGSLRLSAPAPGQWEDYEFSAALASASGQSAAVPAALLSLSPAPAGNFNAGNHSFSLSLSPLALNALSNPDSLV